MALIHTGPRIDSMYSQYQSKVDAANDNFDKTTAVKAALCATIVGIPILCLFSNVF